MRRLIKAKRVCPNCSELIDGTLEDYKLHFEARHSESLKLTEKELTRIQTKKLKKKRLVKSVQSKGMPSAKRQLKKEIEILRAQVLALESRLERKESLIHKKSFYDSDAWKRVRFFTLRDHRTLNGDQCLLCRASGVQLHVDHIKPRSLYPSLALDPSNLQVLCRDCNLGKSNLDETDFR